VPEKLGDKAYLERLKKVEDDVESRLLDTI
jgi:hypothetical protein